jgi:hypothetical protein
MHFPGKPYHREEGRKEAMRPSCRVLVSFALSITLIGIPLPTKGNLTSGRTVGEQEREIPHRNGTPFTPFFRPFIGPDIAHTELFRSKGLSYVHSREFAESVCAVASGTSPFSPDPVPPRWITVAATWKMFLVNHDCEEKSPPSDTKDPRTPTGGKQADADIRLKEVSPFPHGVPSGWERIPGEDEGNIPTLLFRASLDYKAKTGRERTNPVLPRYVRMAALHIRTLLVDQWRKYRDFDIRGMEIAAKIIRAEKLGVFLHAPREVTLAKRELYRAHYVAAEGYYSILDTDLAFAAADDAAENLVALAGNRVFEQNKAIPKIIASQYQ